jgi:hypothetical protein
MVARLAKCQQVYTALDSRIPRILVDFSCIPAVHVPSKGLVEKRSRSRGVFRLGGEETDQRCILRQTLRNYGVVEQCFEADSRPGCAHIVEVAIPGPRSLLWKCIWAVSQTSHDHLASHREGQICKPIYRRRDGHIHHVTFTYSAIGELSSVYMLNCTTNSTLELL